MGRGWPATTTQDLPATCSLPGGAAGPSERPQGAPGPDRWVARERGPRRGPRRRGTGPGAPDTVPSARPAVASLSVRVQLARGGQVRPPSKAWVPADPGRRAAAGQDPASCVSTRPATSLSVGSWAGVPPAGRQEQARAPLDSGGSGRCAPSAPAPPCARGRAVRDSSPCARRRRPSGPGRRGPGARRGPPSRRPLLPGWTEQQRADCEARRGEDGRAPQGARRNSRRGWQQPGRRHGLGSLSGDATVRLPCSTKPGYPARCNHRDPGRRTQDGPGGRVLPDHAPDKPPRPLSGPAL